MHKWTKGFGLLLLGTGAIYFGQAISAGQDNGFTGPAAPAHVAAGSTSSDGSPTIASAAQTDTASSSAADGSSNIHLISDSASISSTEPSGVENENVSPTPRPLISESGVFGQLHIDAGTKVDDELRLIASQAQISIVPSSDVHGTLPGMDLYNVTALQALDAILRTSDLHAEKRGEALFVYSRQGWADHRRDTITTRIFHLHYIAARDADNLIKQLISPDGKDTPTAVSETGIDSGGSSDSGSGTTSPASAGGSAAAVGSSGSVSTGGNSYSGDEMLVVTDYPENLDAIAKVIAEVDHRPQQVLIEATILDATLNENNALGIDFSFAGGVNLDTLLANGTSLTGALSGSVLNNPAAGPVLKQGYAGFSTGTYDQSAQTSGGLQIGVVHDNLAVFLSALEATTDATVVANPKVLVLDKQSGTVHVGQNLGYNGGTTVTQTSSTSTVQFLSTGTILSFRPYVGDDGYIRMEIHPEDSSGSINTSTNPPLPNESVTEVTSNVMVKDGNTIVVGGLFREDDETDKSQVPILGDIPYLGYLFRNQSDVTRRHEVIILLTPHILKDEDKYSRASEEELKDVERLRVGTRQGMMPFGRERLAESCYEAAVAELNQPRPDIDNVLWHLDCATNLNPKFLEAIELKEKITGKQATAVDNSSIRFFVRDQILSDTPPVNATSSATLLPSSLPPIHSDVPATAPLVAALPLPATRPGEASVRSASTATASSSPFMLRFIASMQPTPTTQPAMAIDPSSAPAPASKSPTTQPDVTAPRLAGSKPVQATASAGGK